ncbi:MAG TPA: hypothetical protein VHU80_02270 [Polyangiaceae bacterium]|nr:hypothetical protein [Polyangiaceae bacterium]
MSARGSDVFTVSVPPGGGTSEGVDIVPCTAGVEGVGLCVAVGGAAGALRVISVVALIPEKKMLTHTAMKARTSAAATTYAVERGRSGKSTGASVPYIRARRAGPS